MRNILSKMQPCITVLTHVSSDVSHPSLLLTAKNGQKYLIGRIGEGFQRSIGEQGVRTSKLSGVFLTGKYEWNSVSGLPGMLLSFADRDLSINTLHTGPGLPQERASNMIKSWSNFTFHQPISIQAASTTYTDENVEIRPVTLGGDSTSFIVQLQPTRGRFRVDKAKALGVPPGQLFRQLSEGHSVTIPGTEKVVHAHEIVGPSPVPARALVLDLPTMQHVRNALEDAQLSMFRSPTQATAAAGFDLRAVYYFFGQAVDLNSPLVAELMSKLSDAYTKHYVSHATTSPDFNTLTTMTSFQSTFRAEFPDHFSLLYSKPPSASLPESLASPRLRAHILQQQHILSLVPRDAEEEPTKRAKKAKVEEEWFPPTPSTHESVEGLSCVACHDLSEPEVTTLGTGASAPSKYRNVSSTLVRTKIGSFVFDCGEGTYNTMLRIYGPEGTAKHLRDLRVLYISHMHADHHLGAQQVICAWIAEAQKTELPKLVVATPIQFQNFIKEWAALDGFEESLDKYVTLIDLDTVCVGKRYSSSEPVSEEDMDAAAQKIGGGIEIFTCRAIHCSHSYNGSITVRDRDTKFKVSYSGDTRPNRFFARGIGYGSDLLIHEATHENELAEEAAKKRHSTIGEAIEIARLMGAKNSILTHISQRYPRLPALGVDDGTAVGEGQYACFGFDGMHTKLSQIKSIQEMVPRMGELLESLEVADQ